MLLEYLQQQMHNDHHSSSSAAAGAAVHFEHSALYPFWLSTEILCFTMLLFCFHLCYAFVSTQQLQFGDMLSLLSLFVLSCRLLDECFNSCWTVSTTSPQHSGNQQSTKSLASTSFLFCCNSGLRLQTVTARWETAARKTGPPCGLL